MDFTHTLSGQQHKWSLVHKLGEGDAGEVFLAESLLEQRPAIVKRPRKSAFASESLRQAAQIQTEGKALAALGRIAGRLNAGRVGTPALLDTSPIEEGLGERSFIVIERAAGYDLKSLHQLIRSGKPEELPAAGSGQRFFLEILAGLDHLPETMLVRVFSRVIDLLETIHFSPVTVDGNGQAGVLWNDVKPEHLFWDPARESLTVIDWGNARFLEPGGATQDRQFSVNDDYSQFVDELGAFLAEVHPELHARLEWPQSLTGSNAYSAGVKPLQQRLAGRQAELEAELQDLRAQEAELLSASRPGLKTLARCRSLQKKIAAFGVLPDFAGALALHTRVTLQSANAGSLETFAQVCTQTAGLPAAVGDKWLLLASVADLAGREECVLPESIFAGALAAATADDWPGFLWELFQALDEKPLPDWWEEISQQARRLHLNLDSDALKPYTAVSRAFFTLQSAVLQMGDRNRSANGGSHEVSENMQPHEDLLQNFNAEIIKKWKDPKPAPPHAGIGYRDIGGMLAAMETVLPGTHERLERALQQPQAQVDIVLSAWERRDFDRARRGLRALLVWDPDRRRLMRADRALAKSDQWLADLRQGNPPDQPFYDYLTAIELAGRNLRNAVGPAEWLDAILDALKRLRKGTRSADLLLDYPQLIGEMPWLNEYGARETLSLPRSHPLTLERDAPVAGPAYTPAGPADSRFGPGEMLVLGGALDVWAPEARGSSARVFAGTVRMRDGSAREFAIKVMRPDKAEYAVPLFREEAQVLSLLRDVPGVPVLFESGYLHLDEGQELPPEVQNASASGLTGARDRYSGAEVQNFLAEMDRRLNEGWLPYLVLERRSQENNLMSFCDAGRTRGWFLPLRESLLLGIQICDILQPAHDRNIVYRDHKLLHYYWDPAEHAVTTIDWNIAKRVPQGLSEAERQADLVQFGARALHHILTGRPAPGALPLGPNRPEEIEAASSSYSVQWTYDDERLPNRVKEILEATLAGAYLNPRDLRRDLLQVYEQVREEPTLELNAAPE